MTATRRQLSTGSAWTDSPRTAGFQAFSLLYARGPARRRRKADLSATPAHVWVCGISGRATARGVPVRSNSLTVLSARRASNASTPRRVSAGHGPGPFKCSLVVKSFRRPREDPRELRYFLAGLRWLRSSSTAQESRLMHSTMYPKKEEKNSSGFLDSNSITRIIRA